MKLAFTMAAGRGETDRLVAALADTLARRGLRTCGLVQHNGEPGDGGRCDMDVRVLPDGPRFRISQSLGRGARGCRLDAAALEAAVAEVAARLDARTDILIVNKFGKHEAGGHGFRQLIADALGLGCPVLVGLNGLNRAAFLDFSGGLAAELAPQERVLTNWALTAAGTVPA